MKIRIMVVLTVTVFVTMAGISAAYAGIILL